MTFNLFGCGDIPPCFFLVWLRRRAKLDVVAVKVIVYDTSPLCRPSAMQLKSAITVNAKTFNNRLSFGWGLWQHRPRRFAVVPTSCGYGRLMIVAL